MCNADDVSPARVNTCGAELITCCGWLTVYVSRQVPLFTPIRSQHWAACGGDDPHPVVAPIARTSGRERKGGGGTAGQPRGKSNEGSTCSPVAGSCQIVFAFVFFCQTQRDPEVGGENSGCCAIFSVLLFSWQMGQDLVRGEIPDAAQSFRFCFFPGRCDGGSGQRRKFRMLCMMEDI